MKDVWNYVSVKLGLCLNLDLCFYESGFVSEFGIMFV